MKKLLIMIMIVSNFAFSIIDYKPDFPIVNNLSGFNINASAWNWYPNNREWRETGIDELYFCFSYYSKKNYTINLAYVQLFEWDDDDYSMEVSYNTFPLKLFTNRNAIHYDSESNIDVNSTFSYYYNIFGEFVSINYLLGIEYFLSHKESNVVNCLTLSLNPEHQIMEFYFSYWMKNKPSDDNIWLGFGVNIFLEKKFFFNNLFK